MSTDSWWSRWTWLKVIMAKLCKFLKGCSQMRVKGSVLDQFCCRIRKRQDRIQSLGCSHGWDWRQSRERITVIWSNLLIISFAYYSKSISIWRSFQARQTLILKPRMLSKSSFQNFRKTTSRSHCSQPRQWSSKTRSRPKRTKKLISSKKSRMLLKNAWTLTLSSMTRKASSRT